MPKNHGKTNKNWWNKSVNKSYFKLIFTLFIVFLTFFLLINIIVSTIVRENLEEESKSYNKSSIKLLTNSFETMYLEMSKCASATLKVASKINSLNSYENFCPDDYITLTGLTRDLNSILSIKENVSLWLYYNKEKNLVIANQNIFSADEYFSKFYKYDGISQAEFDQIIEDSITTLLPITTFNEKMINGSLISRDVVPFVMSYKDAINQDALLIMNINSNDIRNETLLYKTSEEMGISIVDSNNRIISSWGTLQDFNLTNSNLKATELPIGKIEISNDKLNGKSSVLMSSRSLVPNWTIHISHAKSEFYEKSNFIFISLVLVNIIVAIIGIIIAYLFSRRLFNPVHKLLSLLYPQTANTRYSKYNELSLISNKLVEIKNDNNELKGDIQVIMPVLHNSFLESMLTNPEFLFINDNEAFLATKFKLDPKLPYILVNVNIVYKQEFINLLNDSDVKTLYKNVYALVKNCITLSFPSFEGIEFNCNKFSFIISVQEDGQKKDVWNRLSEIIELFVYDVDNIHISFVMSDVCNDIKTISEHFLALDDCFWSSLVEGTDKVISVNANQPPLETIFVQHQQLINLIKTGEKDKYPVFIRTILQEGCQLKPSYAQIQLIYREIYNQCVFILKDYNMSSKAISKEEELNIYHIFCVEDFIECCIKLIEKTTSILHGNKTTKHEAYTGYIDENYSDSSLCLETVADYFKITPAYLSKSFKAETGFSFADYLSRCRIKNAKKLLINTKDTIDEVANNVGINNRVTFNRLFNKYEGISPGKFRSLDINL